MQQRHTGRMKDDDQCHGFTLNTPHYGFGHGHSVLGSSGPHATPYTIYHIQLCINYIFMVLSDAAP